jgi:fucose 4-O-acetylase-like acetyltransferase
MGRGADSRDRTLDAFRGVMIVFVVFIHALPYLGLPAGHAWAEAFQRIVTTIAVPGFFLADGMLFARTAGGAEWDPMARLARSARRLLWPWLLFALVYMGLRLAVEAAGLLPRLGPPMTSPVDVARAVWVSTYASGLYFLPSLFLVRAAAIALRPLLADGRVVAVVGLVWPFVHKAFFEPAYLGAVQPVGMDPILHAIWGFGFFALGWAMTAWRDRLNPAVVTAAALALGAASFAPLPAVVGAISFQLGYLLLVYGVLDALSGRGLNLTTAVMLGRRTMGIYLLHAPLVMKALELAITRIADRNSPVALFALALGSLAAAVVLTEAVSRLRLGWLLFGESGGRRRASHLLTER